MKRFLTLLGRGLLAAAFAVSWTAGAVGVGGCGNATGGSEAGNPSRSVVGTLVLPEDAPALALDQAPPVSLTGCPADSVVAVDSRKKTQIFLIEDDCSFALDLFFNKAYSIRFRLGELDVGSMLFQNSPDRFPSPVMELSEESEDISLGIIVLDDGESKPENEPSAQNDADLDGIPDFEDPDDDNDGILDTAEPDCDLDGILDDYDDKNTGCEVAIKPPDDNKVLEVLPRNGAGITTPEDAVLVDRVEIQARFSCELEPTSLNSETFRVTAKDASDSSLLCDLEITDGGTTASCLSEPLVPGTSYEATISSIRCKDGNSIAATTWEWRTASVSGAALPVVPVPAEKIETN